MTRRNVAVVAPARNQWRCLWDGCDAKGLWVTPPLGVSALEDGQAHHEAAHGVKPHLTPDELARVDRGRLDR